MANFDRQRQLFEQVYTQFMATHYGAQQPLAEACSYALEGKGKRVRPLLVMLACEAAGGKAVSALLPALAVELIHTYSLIHDDLPCVDNDDVRRGRPTLHRQFDEATALLAGDALLSDAWAVLAGAVEGAWLPKEAELPPAATLAMIRKLATAVGSQGMVLGQMLDIYWTGRQGYTIDDLNAIHRQKTGALIAASCALGAIAAGASSQVVNEFERFGENLGLAFQVIDDLLDEQVGTGKSQGKDHDQGKVTYLSVSTRVEATALASTYTAAAASCLQGFGDDAQQLRAFAEFLLQRQF